MTREQSNPLTLTLQMLRDEGPRAVWNRVLDLREERRRLRGLTELAEKGGRLSIDFEPPPVLNVSPLPPSPKRGGAQIQMLDRLAEEKNLRSVALAYPRNGIWWLEIWTASNSGIFRLGSEGSDVDLIERAAGLAGASIIHIENLCGLPLSLVKDLKDRGLLTVLSIHDFTLFCRKPHLIERATGEFCEYCQDHRRCERCLDDIDPERSTGQDEYQRAGAEAYESAKLVIYPSHFLQRQYQALFPNLRDSEMEKVIAPATWRQASLAGRSGGRPRMAFVGGVYLHKGGALIAPTMKLVREKIPEAEGFVYGNGESSLFRRLKRTRGVRIRGYYRRGTLPTLLERDRISVAVLPSISPEAYSLVVDECLSAGVPVIAFDHGAPADRLANWNVGDLVSPHGGAEDLSHSIIRSLVSGADISAEVKQSLPRPTSAARRHLDLYQLVKSESGRTE